MLDISLLRDNPSVVRESQRRRFSSVQLVDEVIDLDNKLLAAQQSLEETLQNGGTLRTEDMEDEIGRWKAERDSKLRQIGNIVHESVPVSPTKKDNVVVRTWGRCRSKDGAKGHSKLVKLLDIVDVATGNAVAGGRGYYLKGDGVLLNMALINYGLSFLRNRGYSPLMPPFFIRKSVMANSSDRVHEDFFKITVEAGDEEDKYLIPTSEQPLCAFNSGRALHNLPIRYAGYSTCFRREAKVHCTKDASSIYRVNQFEKVEQFCITSPLGDESWSMLEEMIKVSQLGLPYRVVSVASGVLNSSAAKKYDLQGWFPECGRYRELVSCTNCTDYHSRDLEVVSEQSGLFVHMLNSTLTATERTMCCLLENYQTERGVSIPKVLQPFMMGVDFLPFKQGESVSNEVQTG